MSSIQVIDRAFYILEKVASNSPVALKLTQICDDSGLNIATASRISKALCDNGYLEQADRKAGYVLGYKSFSLSRNISPNDNLLETIKPLMTKFSKTTQEYICYSVLKDDYRFISHSIMCKHIVRAEHYNDIETPYRSVSGRLLLSSLSNNEQRLFWKRNTLPGDKWPAVTDESTFLNQLKTIASQEIVIESNDDHTALAVPLYKDCKVAAALGVFLPTYRFKGEHKKEIERQLIKISNDTNHTG